MAKHKSNDGIFPICGHWGRCLELTINDNEVTCKKCKGKLNSVNNIKFDLSLAGCSNKNGDNWTHCGDCHAPRGCASFRLKNDLVYSTRQYVLVGINMKQFSKD